MYLVVPPIDVLDTDALPIGGGPEIVHVVCDVGLPHELRDHAASVDDVVRACRTPQERVDGRPLVDCGTARNVDDNVSDGPGRGPGEY